MIQPHQREAVERAAAIGADPSQVSAIMRLMGYSKHISTMNAVAIGSRQEKKVALICATPAHAERARRDLQDLGAKMENVIVSDGTGGLRGRSGVVVFDHDAFTTGRP